jgi:serine/threonine protein kinase
MAPTRSICPVCGASRAGQQPICDQCGVVFASRPTITRLQPGQLLARGRYTVQRALSKGGMGAIYLATDHEAFDRTVVVKAMLDYFDPADPQAARAAQERFVQEARTLAALRHPAIPQIFTYFVDGPHNYIVMEYIEGHDLLQRLSHAHGTTGRGIPGRPYAREDVLRWGVALCRVLEYLASRQPHPVVHHDIKPANLLLDRNSGDIRLVDFGTARARLLAQGGAAGLRQSSLYGTQGYAAPEQYGGQSEARSDVYALAATLYHLATDDDPRGHPFDFPRLKELGALGPALARALENDVAQRPTAAKLRRQLEDLLAPSASQSIQTPDGLEVYDTVELARWCEANWQPASAWLYGVLPEQIERVWGRTRLAQQLRDSMLKHRDDRNAGLDAALALLDPNGFGAARPQVITATQALDFGALAPRVACEQLLILANSGRRHVDAALGVPGWISASTMAISLPPGERMAIELSAEGWRAPTLGQLHDNLVVHDGPTTLLEVETWAAVSRWSSFWQRQRPWSVAALAALSLALLLVWALWPVQQTVVFTRYDVAPTVAVSPAPSATALAPQPAAVAGTPAPASGAHVADAGPEPTGVVRAQQGETLIIAAPPQLQGTLFQALKTLTERKGQFDSAAFSPDGQALGVGDAKGMIQLWMPADNRLLWSSADDHEPIRALVFSPDGKLLAASGAGGTITLRQAGDGQLLATLDGHAGPVEGLAFSPDGQTLASVGGTSLTLWQVADRTMLWTVEEDDSIHSIAFSPDGATLASAGADGAVKLWQAADGELIRTLAQRSGALSCVALSPDGQTLALGSADGAIELVRVEDGTAFRSLDIKSGPVWSVAFSADGVYLAAASDDASVRILRASDGALLQTLDTDRHSMRQVRFSPTSTMLIAAGDGNTIMFWRAIR